MRIGEILAEARRKQGKSIRDVEKATRITAKYIEAIENDNYDVLPAPVYAKGFIRNMAIFLDVDHEPLLRQFNIETQINKQPEVHRSYTPVNIGPRSAAGSKLILLAIGALLGLIALVWLFGLMLGSDDRNKPERESVSPALIETATSDIKINTTDTGSASAELEALDIPSEMKISFTSVAENGCWLLVEADGSKVFEDVLAKGSERTFTAKRKMMVKVGNPEGVTVIRDGKKLGVFDKDAIGVTTRTYLKTDKF